MGLDILSDVTNGDIVDQGDPNIIHRVLEGDFVGRDSSGAPTAGQNLGTLIIPWGTIRATDLIIDGQPVDPGLIAAALNRVVSGAIRSASAFPDYLRPAGTGASFTLLATATDLKLNINGVEVDFAADVVKSSLTAAPGSNNTCLINDVGLTGQDTTKNLGENGTLITIDAVGSEISSRVGEFIALLNQTSGEIMYCRVESATQLSNARRGFFFNSSGLPVERAVLNNNEVLQILSLGFIFAENDGATVDVTYANPVIGGDEPDSPGTGDYWLDLEVFAWKKYSGSVFVQVNRTFVGYAVIDTTDCIGARPEDFGKAYQDYNSLEVVLQSVDIIRSSTANFIVSVDGVSQKFGFSFLRWDASTDFESGVTRTKDRDYWLYITEDGLPIISDKKPYDRIGFLRGWYHPHNSWRAVAQLYNNSSGASGEFELVSGSDKDLEYLSGFPGEVALGTIANNGILAIDFSSRIVQFGEKILVAPALTKIINVNWSPGNNQGGLDTGTVTTDTWYYCYLIYNPLTVEMDYLFTKTLGSPTLPAGYTESKYVGSIRGGSASILGFQQIGRDFIWVDASLDAGGAYAVTTNLTLLTPLGMVTKARIHISIGLNNFAPLNWSIRSKFQNPFPIAVTWMSSGSFFSMSLYTDVLSEIVLDRDASANTVMNSAFYTTGWTDHNLEA